jgi:hypothetical protein
MKTIFAAAALALLTTTAHANPPIHWMVWLEADKKCEDATDYAKQQNDMAFADPYRLAKRPGAHLKVDRYQDLPADVEVSWPGHDVIYALSPELCATLNGERDPPTPAESPKLPR